MPFSFLGHQTLVPHWGGGPGAIAPVADFSADDTTPAVDQSVQFTDLSTNDPTSWDWDWGDGTAHGNTQNPTHTYTIIGTFTVILIATNSAGNDTETKVGYITVTPYTLNFTGLSAFPAGWTAPNWTVSANTAKNTPTEGVELLQNPGFEAFTGGTADNWIDVGSPTLAQESTIVHGGSSSQKITGDATVGDGVRQYINTTAGQWYKWSVWLYTAGAGNTIRAFAKTNNGSDNIISPSYTGAAWSQVTVTGRAVGATSGWLLSTNSANAVVYCDDGSLKALSNLIAYRDLGENDVIVKAPWTIGANSQAGVIALSDGTLNNCLKGGYNRATGTVVLLQYVGGVVSVLISPTVVAYSAGGDVEIRISTNGTVAKLYYNNVQVGTDQTPNAAIQANTVVGLFSTDVSNTVPSLSVAANP